MSKYRNAIYYDFKSLYLVIFYRDYRHRLVLKIPFPDNIFPKISKLIINEPINKSRCNDVMIFPYMISIENSIEKKKVIQN